ncbi:MAG: protein-glutamate O-methyltransferase CheR [Phycisphaerales bacterium]
MSALKQRELDRIAALAYERWGLNITNEKHELVTTRLIKHLRKSRFESPGSYIDFLESEATHEELLEFFDVLSTNVTSFFRDPGHFAFLERDLYTPLSRGTTTLPNKAIRLWSAACSTGMEPYSLAINALESLSNPNEWDIKILATDLSNKAVAEAIRGVYPESAIASIPKNVVKKYFLKGSGANAGTVKVSPEVQRLITFRRLNLMDPWPMSGPFQSIFCRNVMIYFDVPTREKLVNRMADLLQIGGTLVVGSCESLHGVNHPFKSAQANIYRR